jgi:hypothetical protein
MTTGRRSSSLTDQPGEADLRGFFEDRILPAAAALRERGVAFFPLAPDRNATTYWSERPADAGYVFQIGENLAGELHALWREHPELQALADDLARMASAMAERRDQSSDVSPFIYAMY